MDSNNATLSRSATCHARLAHIVVIEYLRSYNAEAQQRRFVAHGNQSDDKAQQSKATRCIYDFIMNYTEYVCNGVYMIV